MFDIEMKSVTTGSIPAHGHERIAWPVDPLPPEEWTAWCAADAERLDVEAIEAWLAGSWCADALDADCERGLHADFEGDGGSPPTDPDPPPGGRDGLSGGLDQSEVALWRHVLAEAVLPHEEAALVGLLRELEDLRSAAAAVQARVAVAFDAARRQGEADRGVAPSKRGKGIGGEVALARRESPFRGGRLLGLAKALVHELPHTLRALAAGTLNEWRATIVARETACLGVEDRLAADAWLAEHLVAHPTLGDRRLAADIQRKVIELDQAAVVRRRAKAAGGRRVSTRPLPDGMVQFTAILPLVQGIALLAALKQAADAHRAAGGDPEGGEQRSHGAVMADTLFERVTGRPAEDPADVTVNVVITDEALLSESEEPAHVDGYGPISAAWARRLIADTVDSSQLIALRRLFRGPGRMIRMETASRRFTGGLRDLIALRDQQCRTPWCDAPIRHTDHVRGHAEGGSSSYRNGQGLCEACNYAKQATGWRATAKQDPTRGHVVTVTTPTGHSYESTQPAGPA
ncbi:DUF222 domain-containing protein [Granulicoccus sp. GXG6511]|uniref:HNH endonuclease n=1 Tax=Granulicoccus sp. GXG6511 TaxID=3381351 RepID=UPI003D7E94AD